MQMGDIKNISKRLFAAFMLLIFMEHIISATLFAHQHTIDGQTITHSHIHFGTSQSPNHTHTIQQINLIAALSTIKVVVAAIAMVFIAPLHVVVLLTRYTIRKVETRVLRSFSLRAPPIVALY